MCGRFNITSDPLAKLLMRLVGLPLKGVDKFNVAPTQDVEVLRVGPQGEVQLVPMRWWLTPFWAKELSTKYAMFNARSETAAKSAAFREPYKRRRCVVPISGFYEWCRENNQKVPYFITSAEHDGMLLAGLWDSWQSEQGEAELLSFTILTTVAHREIEFLHHRQPVLLSVEQASTWLDADIPTRELEYLFASNLPMSLEVRPVSVFVNNVRNKDARCFQGIAASVCIAAQPETLH